MKPLAFVDVETTGLDPARHEVVEVAAVRVDGRSLEVLGEAEVRVRPERLHEADPEALRVNGLSAARWSDAVPLREALERVMPLLDGAVLAGHNVWFDRAFLEAACRSADVALPLGDHHLLDTAVLAWPLLAAGEVESLSLDAVCGRLGIERPLPHRALADARCSLEVARRLLPRARIGTYLGALEADERQMVETLLARMHAGRSEYGPWRTDDGRVYPREALMEVIDALNYCAAELVRLTRAGTAERARRVYVCHPFGADPEGNAERVRVICRQLADSGLLPVAPQVYLPQFLDEAAERDRALALCLELLRACDEVRVYGGRITEGMRMEIAHAEAHGVPVRFVETEAGR